jgi:hypothetical protein
MEAYDKALMIYNSMYKKNLVKKEQKFVLPQLLKELIFKDDDEGAKHLARKINDCLKPRYNETMSLQERTFEDILNRSHEMNYEGKFDSLGTINIRTEDEMLNHAINDAYSKLFMETYEQFYKSKTIQDFVLPETERETEEMREKRINLAERILEDPQNVEEHIKEWNKIKTRKRIGKVNYKPVIFGLKGEVHYPKDLSFDLLNKETIKKAKLEFIESLDPNDGAREASLKKLNESTVIHWLDENGNIVKGIVH